MQANIYIYFNGNCEEAMNYYKGALGASIEMLVRYSDAPKPSDDAQKNKILHGVLDIGGSKVYCCDSSENHKTVTGDNFSVSLRFDTQEECNSTFANLSAGGKIIMPLQDTFWGAWFGMCADKYAIHWMFNWEKPKG
jgi:PhnB protein